MDYELYKFIGVIIFSATTIGSLAYVFYRIAIKTPSIYLAVFIHWCAFSYFIWPIVFLVYIGYLVSGPMILFHKLSRRFSNGK